jgi:general secretion pathway protein L
MPANILGLDIGASALKAVLLSRGFGGRYRMLGARRIDLAAAGGLTEAVKQLFTDRTFCRSVCVTALPSGVLSFRNINLPFRDDRKIRQTLPFAIEPLIQTPIDEVFIDYLMTGRAGQTEIFAAIAPRAIVRERSGLLIEYVREMAVIDIDAVPLAARLMENPDFPATALLLDVGAREAVAVFIERGRIMHIRNFPFGGEIVTGVMAEAMKAGVDEMENVKRGGEMAPAAAAALQKCLDRFLLDLKNTQAYLLWQGNLSSPPEGIILAGGGSRTIGLAEGLAEMFCVTVERTDLAAEEGIEIGESLRESWDPAVMDQALALAARPMAKGRGFNFRQRASEARAGYGELRDRLKKGVAAGVVILILAGIEIGLDDYGARLRLAAQKDEITRQFKKSYPEVTRIVDPVAQLRGKIAEARRLSAGRGDVASPVAVLDLLKELAGLAPTDLVLTSLNLDGDVVGLKGEAKNFDSVDTIKKAFANSKSFKSVTIGSTSMVKQGTAVEFDLKIQLKK